MFTVCSRGCKIGGAFVSNFANQKIDGARLGCVVIKLPKVGGAIAPSVPPPLCSNTFRRL